MATLQATQVAQRLPVPSACGYEPVTIFGDYAITAATANGDIVDMVPIPAGYTVVDVILDTEDCGGTITADVGVMSGAYGDTSGSRTCGAEFMSAKALGTAGIYRMDVSGGGRIAPTTADRSIGVKFTALTTPTVGAKFRLTALVRPQLEGA